MIYQIYYDDKILNAPSIRNNYIKTFGVHNARALQRHIDNLYDDDNLPNLSEHNTLCEWRVLYYIWKHFPTKWVGFTSWQHDRKGFLPNIDDINAQWIETVLNIWPITGFITLPLYEVMIKKSSEDCDRTLKQQFLQWSTIKHTIGKSINDTRGMPLGRYHTAPYWEFVMNTYRDLYGADLGKELDWDALGQVDALHTWCNAFVAHWSYFDSYMKMFSPIVMEMLKYFGSHPIDLELSYVCERLIIIFNYIRYSNNDFS